MKNNYWFLRHGRSLANEAGIIISQKENGVKPEYRLADLGRSQAKEAGRLLKEQLAALPAAPLYIYTSPFSRTVETAALAGAEVGVDQNDSKHFQMTDLLMERNFGTALEGKPYGGTYEAIWAQDAVDANYVPGGDGESVTQVSNRIKSLVQSLETCHEGCNIVLVSHGDTCAISHATLVGADIKHHQQFPYENAQLKRIEL